MIYNIVPDAIGSYMFFVQVSEYSQSDWRVLRWFENCGSKYTYEMLRLVDAGALKNFSND